MNRITKYIIFTYILMFLCTFNVNAECSYQERKEMLNIAKNVDISVEAVEVSAEKGKYDFKFNITGLTKDIFIKYYNLNDGNEQYITYEKLQNSIFSFTDENSLLTYEYKFKFYSNNEKCLGYELTTKTIKKPMYNIYSENINCTYESNENFKYCTKFLEKNHYITKDKFIDELTKYHTKNPIEEETNKTNKTKKPIFIYGVISLFIILVIIVISVIIKKRKSEL